MAFPDFSLIGNYLIALAIVALPVEVFILLNVAKFRVMVTAWLLAWSSPETRKSLFGEIAHGVMRALQERAGSMKGAAVKAENAGNLAAALGGDGGALGLLPGKIDLPIIGKVTIGEALQLFQTLKGVLGGAGANRGFQPQQTSTGNTELR
jgi:hypothetical protein